MTVTHSGVNCELMTLSHDSFPKHDLILWIIF